MASFSYDFVNERLAVGGKLNSAKDVRGLEDMGITHVIDLREDFNDAQLFRAASKIKLLYNGAPDDGKPKPLSWFRKSLEFALPALAKPHNKVYVHCYLGVHRGPSMAYAILRAQGMTQKQAAKMVKKKRKQADLIYAGQADQAVKELGYF